MPDPISLAAGYFILKTALSMGISLGENVTASSIGNELIKAAGGNFYYDLIKSGAKFGGKTAWKNIVSRIRSEYNSNNTINHDLQKAIRRAQIEATLSACEACFEEFRVQDRSLLEKLRNKLLLSDEETWLKNVIQSLTKNLAETRREDYVPPPLTNDLDVLKIADNRNYSLAQESVLQLVDSMKEQTVLEIRLANPPSYLQDSTALSLEQKINNGWAKEFQGEVVFVDWYKLLCDRFNEEYKDNPKVNAALQKAFFQDIKADLAGRFSNYSEHHFEELGGRILAKLVLIDGKQDRLYEFIELFRDETDKKLTEALDFLRLIPALMDVSERTAGETQQRLISAIERSEQRVVGHIDHRFYEIDELLKKQEAKIARSFDSRDENIYKKLDKIEKLLEERNDKIHLRIESQKPLSPEDEFFFSLKERYKLRYNNKLDNRFEITLEVDELLEITEKFKADAGGDRSLNVINNSFEEHGRLLIVGNPGVGKTLLLLKLANNLLDRADISRKDAFPVIFNLASWSEEYENFEDWLLAMLHQSEGLSIEISKMLLYQERIIFLLDGLDELARQVENKPAAEVRGKCLRSINKYLSRGKKVVICCRSDEFLQLKELTGQDAPVSAKVEILNLTKSQVLTALLEARSKKDITNRASSNNLLKILVNKNLHEKLTAVDPENFWEIISGPVSTLDEREQNDLNDLIEKILDPASGSFMSVLQTPFYFTLALEVFDRQIFEEHTFPNDERSLKKYLLDNYIERKLKSRVIPNPYHFGLAKTRKWLKWLAVLMGKKQLVTFELSTLQPSDVVRRWIHSLLVGILSGLILGLFCGVSAIIFASVYTSLTGELSFEIGVFGGIGLGLILGPIFGLIFALLGGFWGGVYGGLLFGLEREPGDVPRSAFSNLFQPGHWKEVLIFSLVIGLCSGIPFGFASGVSKGIPTGILRGFGFGMYNLLIFGLLVGLLGGREKKPRESIIAPARKKSFSSSHWGKVLIFGVVFGLVWALLGGLSGWLWSGFENAVSKALSYGLSAGILFGLIMALFGKLENEKNLNRSNFLELFKWAYWKKILFVSLLIGLVFGLFGLIFFDMKNILRLGIMVSGFSGLILGLFFGLIGGFEDKTSTEDIVKLRYRNFLTFKYWQKILFISLAFGLIFGLCVSSPIGVVFGGIFGFISSLEGLKDIRTFAYLEKPYQRIQSGFFINLSLVIFIFLSLIGLIIFFRFSSTESFQAVFVIASPLLFYFSFIPLMRHSLFHHFILRLVLYFESSAPLKYVRFLNYAAEARLLEKDGGQWRFCHQELQDYFANLQRV